MKLTVGIFLAAALVLASGGADAEGTSDLTLFSISKSENRNQVVYAIRVDAACRPAGPTLAVPRFEWADRDVCD